MKKPTTLWYGVYKTSSTTGYTDVWGKTYKAVVAKLRGNLYSGNYVFIEAASPEEALQKAGIGKDI